MKKNPFLHKYFILTILFFSQSAFSKSVALSCVDNTETELFYTMAYMPPKGFVYEDGTKVTEKNYEGGFDMTRENGFLIMIDTESLDGFLTYDFRLMKSTGARYGYKRTRVFQKKEKVIKTDNYYVFDNSEKNDFPAIQIHRKDLSKTRVVESLDRMPDYWGYTPCEVIDLDRYDYLHREYNNIVAHLKKISDSENQF
jgi:hypothetical protein